LVSYSQRRQISEVFTLNFDDILERYLGYHGIIAKPVLDERFWAEPADVLIHHPHGFLPSPGSPFRMNSSFLVFDERSYLEQSSDSRWNQRMEVTMQAHICLFIGLGRSDLHLKQLVSRTAGKHAFSPVKDGFWGIVLRAGPQPEEIRDWAHYHVHVEPLVDYHTDLPSLLFCRMSKRSQVSIGYRSAASCKYLKANRILERHCVTASPTQSSSRVAPQSQLREPQTIT
jgi:SIR2-like domain